MIVIMLYHMLKNPNSILKKKNHLIYSFTSKSAFFILFSDSRVDLLNEFSRFSGKRILDLLIDVFSIDFDNKIENLDFIPIDGNRVKYILSTDEETDTQKFLDLSVIFNLKKCLKIDVKKENVEITLRKLVAFGYYINSFSVDEIAFSISETAQIIKLCHENIKDFSMLKIAATAISFCVANIGDFINTKESSSLDRNLIFNITEESLSFFLLPDILCDTTISLFFNFFISALYFITNLREINENESKILIHLSQILVFTISMPVNIDFDSMALTGHILTLLSSGGNDISLSLSLETKTTLFQLVTAICSKFKGVSDFIFDDFNIEYITDFICDITSTIKVEEVEPKNIKLSSAINKKNLERKFIEPTFESPIKAMDEKERIFVPRREPYPSLSSEIKKSSEFTTIITAIGKLVSIKKSAAEREEMQSKLLISVMQRDVSKKEVQFIYLIEVWMKMFMKSNSDSSIKVLHERNFFNMLLDLVFFHFPEENLINFFTDFIFVLTQNSNEENDQFVDMFLFFIQCCYTFSIPDKFLKCFMKCILVKPNMFAKAAEKVNFKAHLNSILIDTQQYHSEHHESEECAETRRKVFHIIDVISSTKCGIEYLWSNDMLYIDGLLTLLYDPSTSDFAAYQISLGFKYPELNESVFKSVFQLFERIFNFQQDISDITMNTLLICLNDGFLMDNGKLESILKETNFLIDLIKYTVEQKKKNILINLLNLIKSYSRNYTADDYYLMLFPILESREFNSKILELIFDDDKGMMSPREIVSASPFAVLMVIESQEPENLEHFFNFIKACCDFSATNIQSLASCGLQTQVICFMKKYREKESGDTLFDSALAIFERLAKVALTSNNLCNYFQILPSLANSKRPFYSRDAILALNRIFQHEEREISFFHCVENGGYVRVKENIPVDVFNNGFTVYINAKLVSNTVLFRFTSSSCISTLSLENGCFSYSEEQEKGKMITKINVGTDKIPTDFIPFVFSKDKNKIHIYIDNKVYSKECSNSYKHKNSIVDAIFGKVSNGSFDIEKIIIFSEKLEDKFVSLLTSIPGNAPPISFHKSEKYILDQEFKEIFSDKFKEKVFAIFDANITDGTTAYSMCSDVTASINGTVNSSSIPATNILNSIGGPLVLLPIFTQIMQVTTNNKTDDDLLLILLKTLRIVFTKSAESKVIFYRNKGVQICGFLLSLLPAEKLTSEIIDELFAITDVFNNDDELTNSAVDSYLVDDMCSCILFDLNLWLYVPTDIQKMVLQKIREREMIISSFSLARILDVIKIFLWETKTDFSLLDKPKMIIGQKNAATSEINTQKRPEEVISLRRLLLDFAQSIGCDSLTKEDVERALFYAFDSSDDVLQYDFIIILEVLIRNKKEEMFKCIQSDNAFIPNLINLFSSKNCLIVTSAATILSEVCELKFSGKYSFNQLIIHGMEKMSIETNIDEAFNKLIDVIFCNNDYYHNMFPLLIYILPKTTDVEKNINEIKERIQTNNCKDSHSFIFWILILIATNASDEIALEENLIANKLIHLLVILLLDDIVYFSQFISLVQTMSVCSGNDYGFLLREIYIRALRNGVFHQIKDLEEPGIEYAKLFQSIFIFMFYIPSYDRYFLLPIESTQREQEKKTTFFELVLSITSKNVKEVNYAFATRTDEQMKWKDEQLGRLFLKEVFSREKLFSFDLGKFSIIEAASLVYASLVQHCDTDKELQSFYDSVTCNIARIAHKCSPSANSIMIIISAFMRKYIRGDRDKSIIQNFHTTLVSYRPLFETILSTKFHELRTVDQTINEVLNQPTKLSQLMWNEIIRVEDVYADLSEQVDLFFNKSIANDLNHINIHYTTFTDIDVKAPEESFFRKRKITHKDQIEIDIQNTARNYEMQRKRSLKLFKKLFDDFSGEGRPWMSVENNTEKHYKLSNNTFSGGMHNRFVRNLNYDSHKEASLARDCGSIVKAKREYEEILKEKGLTQFKGDPVLIATENEIAEVEFAEENIDSIVLSLNTTHITPSGVDSGTLSLYPSKLTFTSKKKDIAIEMSMIKKLFFRRYLHHNTAIELFITNYKSYFFNFEEGMRDVFLSKFKKFASGRKKTLNSLKFLQEKQEDVRTLAKNAYERWQRGEISTFKMLMKLNKYSGRSFSVLSGYPVFPWIISDYKSETLDLKSESSYRDLSKPIGAMNSKRINELIERREESFGNERYLYGSFYSSAAVVIGYLIRCEPFASHHIELQSGRFDHSDRLFTSVPKAYDCVTSTALDFREIIPEFFYLPEMFVNDNKIDLGILSTGESANVVELPKWADNDPKKFVKINMEALESDYVSANIHQWIDLIFGPNARFPNSVEANNDFHPYFYETALTKEALQDPLKVNIIQEYAVCFGTAPDQLFTTHLQPRIVNIMNLQISNSFPLIEADSESKSKIIAVKSNKNQNSLCSISKDLQCLLYSITDESKETVVKLSNFTNQLPKDVCIVGDYIVATYPYDKSFFVYDLSKSKFPVYIHRANYCHISSITSSGNYFATVADDMTITLWKFQDSCVPIQVRIIVMHSSDVLCVAINSKSDLCISASKDGRIISTELSNGEFLRAVKYSSKRASHISIGESGYIVVCSNLINSCQFEVFDHNLEKFNVDSKLTKSEETNFNATALEQFSAPNGKNYVIIATNLRQIVAYELPWLQNETVIAENIDASAISVGLSNVLVVGTQTGKTLYLDLMQYFVPNKK